jgi:hypothetical protein
MGKIQCQKPSGRVLETVKWNVVLLQVVRNILATEPRVTRFKINWDDTDTLHQSTENTTHTLEEEFVSSNSAVGFSENSSQSAMEVM